MNRLSWIFIISTAVIVIIIGFFLKPLASSCWQLQKEIKQAKIDLDDVAKEKEILTKLNKNNQLSNLYNIASIYIPEEQKSGELVIELSAIANQSNLKVEQVSFDTKKTNASKTDTDEEETSQSNQTDEESSSEEKEKYKETEFSLRLSGAFNDFLTLLKNIETSSRLISITEMTLSQEEEILTVQISGKAYWQKGSTLEKTLANIAVSQETIDKFQNLKTYGSPINLSTESGFGRPDPFAEIK